jgi:hypothetical protein
MDGAGYSEEANLAWTDADATGGDEVGMGMAADGGAHIELQQDYSGPAAPDVGSSVYAPDVGNSVYAPADDDGMETELARAPPSPPSHSSSLSLYREGALCVVCAWQGPESCVDTRTTHTGHTDHTQRAVCMALTLRTTSPPLPRALSLPHPPFGIIRRCQAWDCAFLLCLLRAAVRVPD